MTSRLYTYRATDPEGSATITWSVGGVDARFFAIDELGQFSFDENNPPDFEQPGDSGRDNVYNVTVQARDEAFNASSLEVTVTVTNHNEGVQPTISTRRPPSTYQENRTTTVYTFRAADPDRQDKIRWLVEGADGADFAIHDGMLTFRRLPDLEAPVDADQNNVHEITVVEDYDITRALGTYTATDAKDRRQVYPQWSLSGRDGGDFLIDRYSGVLTFRNSPDYERPADADRDNVYEVTSRGHDSRAYGYLEVVVTVTNINESAPVVTGSAARTVQENTASTIYTYRATDADLGGTIAWSTGGDDGRHFVIAEDRNGRGLLAFAVPPDFEYASDSDLDNVYDLDVVDTDGAGLRGTL